MKRQINAFYQYLGYLLFAQVYFLVRYFLLFCNPVHYKTDNVFYFSHKIRIGLRTSLDNDILNCRAIFI